MVPSPIRLTIPVDLWQAMLDHIRSCAPDEACGLAIGRLRMVTEIHPIENQARSPVRFRMDPEAQVRELLDLEARGMSLLAIYHSHPAGAPLPSPTDLAEWQYPEALSLIWGCDDGQWQARAYDLSGPRPVEAALDVAPD